jgi:glycosyltransferase involved in cell wall biosynthesis
VRIALPNKFGGGAGTWIQLFGDYLLTKGYKVIRDLNDDFDLLINVADLLPLEIVNQIRQRKTKILHRMDGIYWGYLYSPKAVADRNENLRKLMLASDTIVFQSHFVKNIICQKLLGYEIQGEVIYNAVDPMIFNPDGDILEKPAGKNLIISIANWGPANLAIPVLKNIFSVAEMLQNRDYEFWIYGYAHPETVCEMAKLKRTPNLQIQGLGKTIDHYDMPKYLRTADILLHLRPNDPCPNLIMEAMSSGTPVIGLKSGSLPELLGDTNLLAGCTDSIDEFPTADLESVCQKIINVLDNLSYYQTKIQERAKLFSIDLMGEKYLEQIKKFYLREGGEIEHVEDLP